MGGSGEAGSQSPALADTGSPRGPPLQQASTPLQAHNATLSPHLTPPTTTQATEDSQGTGAAQQGQADQDGQRTGHQDQAGRSYDD